jgi:signal peptidase I
MKQLNKLIKLIFNITLIAVILSLGILLLLPMLGYTPVTIISGSMEPQYPVGSLIIVKEVSPLDIRNQDVISYKQNNESSTYITHRVIAIDSTKREFTTKGDNNVSPDIIPIGFNKLLGKVVLSFPYIGFITYYISLPIGKIFGFLAIIGLFLLSYLFEKLTA